MWEHRHSSRAQSKNDPGRMGRCSAERLKPEISSIALFPKLLAGCFWQVVKSFERSRNGTDTLRTSTAHFLGGGCGFSCFSEAPVHQSGGFGGSKESVLCDGLKITFNQEDST